jgi:hypothetical protein
MTHAMNRSRADAIIKELRAAVGPVLEKHGLELTKTSGNYDTLHLGWRIETTVQNEDGFAYTCTPEEWAMYTKHAHRELDGVKLGDEFTYIDRPGKFKIVGYRPRAPKRPIQAVNTTDKCTYNFSVAAVAMALGKPRVSA